jgi:hypothetical protein
MSVGADEEPDKEPCQSHGQRSQVHLGCFGGEETRKEKDGEIEREGVRFGEKKKRVVVGL